MGTVLVDTSILSTFARIGRLELLPLLYSADTLAVTPAVRTELERGAESGYTGLGDAVALVHTGTLGLCKLTPDEDAYCLTLPATLGGGEAESIAVCRTRRAALLTNDRRARNVAKDAGVEVYDLGGILRALWRDGILGKSDVRCLIDDIESKDRVVITRKEEIFADESGEAAGSTRPR